MGICEVLTVVFVVLKLIGKISWSWGYVLLPEIIAVGLYIVVLVMGIIQKRRISRLFWD